MAVRCPEFAHILRRAGGMWASGTRRWLVTRYRVGPVICALERETNRCSGRLGCRWADLTCAGPLLFRLRRA